MARGAIRKLGSEEWIPWSSDIDAETLAGLFINKLGLLPKVGDKIDLDNMILSITAADKRKVKKIGITIKTNI